MAVLIAHAVYIVVLISVVSSVTPPTNITVIELTTPTKQNTDATTSRDATKCEFYVTDPQLRDELSESLAVGAKLIKFSLRFKDYPLDVLNSKGGDLFRPESWVRSTSRQGESLLMLDDNFEVLSLSLLGIGVSRMDVVLDERPFGCMNSLTWQEKVNKTRNLLLNDFKVPVPGEKSGSLQEHEHICNMRVSSESGIAEFVYHCCHVGPDDAVICEDINRDIWITVLLVCVIIIKVLVVLYSPSFIPETLYRKKYTATNYVYKIPPGKKKKKLKIVKTSFPETYTSPNPSMRLDDLEGFEYLKLSLRRMQDDVIYDIKLNRIELSAKSRKLLSENYVPVSILKMIYENVFRCKMRSIPVLKPCCDTPVCGSLDVGCKVMPWFRCLRIFCKLVLISILAIPWIIRLIIYFMYEAVLMEKKLRAAEQRGLKLNFSGSFTLFLTPLHGLFIATYIIVTIDSFAYGLLGKRMKARFSFILRKCLRDMRERSRLDAYGWAIALALIPIKKFGIVGFFLAPLFWLIILPFVIPVLAFYTFPALNLSIRLIIHLFIFMCPSSVVDRFNNMSMKLNIVKKNLKLDDIGEEEFHGKGNMSKKEILIILAIIVMCLTSFWSLTFLLMECLSFFVEIGVYTLMGIIVNAGATLQYITLLFLIYMYANSSFGGVSKMYLAYHKIIAGQLLAKKKDEIHATARQDEIIQEDVAFRVHSNYNASDVTSGVELEVKDGLLRWDTKGLLVFLNKVDEPFTPRKFFFDTIDMQYCGCPGPLWRNTLKAFYNFMKIMVFLIFVVIVVLAFGNQFSTTNQMLATLAGGFVPFVFRNFFSKGSSAFTVDTESVQFVTEFNKAIANYTQKWPVADIIPDSGITESSVVDGFGDRDEVNTETTELPGDVTFEDGDDNNNKEDTPLVGSNDVRVDLDSDTESETDNTKVDLIIDIARYDSLNRRLGKEGSVVNVGSMSMLGDGNAPIYNPERIVQV